MGCALCVPQDPLQRNKDADNSFSFSKPASLSAAAAELLSEGSQKDQERMSAILQLSLSLSLLATERGRTEGELCEAVVNA